MIVMVLKDFCQFIRSLDIKSAFLVDMRIVLKSRLVGRRERMVMLRDLTREDIRLYIKERLEKDDLFVQLEEEDDGYTKNDLIIEILITRKVPS